MADTQTLTPTGIALNNFLYRLSLDRARHIERMKPLVEDLINNKGKPEPSKPSDSKPADDKSTEPGPSEPTNPTPVKPSTTSPTTTVDTDIEAARKAFFQARRKEGKTYPFDKIVFKKVGEISDDDRASILKTFAKLSSGPLLSRLKMIVSGLPSQSNKLTLPALTSKVSPIQLAGEGYPSDNALRAQKVWFKDVMDLFRISRPLFAKTEEYKYLTQDELSGDAFNADVDDDMLEASKSLLQMFNNSSY